MATLTINTTPAQDSRILEAFGKYLGTVEPGQGRVPRDATPAEVKASIVKFIKKTVKRHEDRVAADAAVAAVAEIEIT